MCTPRARTLLLVAALAVGCSDGPEKSPDTSNATAQTTGMTTGATSGFADAVTFPLGMEPRTPLIADFDGDGALDIAVVNQFSSDVQFFVGDGTGGFTASSDTLIRASDAVAADFDGDGIADLALAADGEASVEIVQQPLGASLRSSLSLPALSLGLATADFNGDGEADLAAAVSGTGAEPGARVAVFTWGEDTFDPVSFASVGLQPTQLAAVDDDIVVLLGTKSALQLTNDGTGTFAASAPFGVGDGVLSFAMIDLDMSGSLDLVSADLTGDRLMASLDFPRTDGQLLAEVAAPYDVIAFNGNDDDQLDVAITSIDEEAVIGLISKEDGTYGRKVLADLSGAVRLGGLAAADVNGDGLDDLLVVERQRDSEGVLHILLTVGE